MGVKKQLFYVVNIIDGVKLMLLFIHFVADIAQHPEKIQDEADCLQEQKDAKDIPDNVRVGKDQLLRHGEGDPPAVDGKRLVIKIEVGACGPGDEDHVAGSPFDHTPLQSIVIVALRHGTFAKLPDVSRLGMPGIHEKIAGISIDDINGGFSAVWIGYQFLRQRAQLDHAVEHGDGFAVSDDRHKMAQNVAFIFGKASLPVGDVGAGGRLLLKGKEARSIRPPGFGRKNGVIRQEQLKIGHHADGGIGRKPSFNLRGGQILIFGKESGDRFQLSSVVIGPAFNFARQSSGFLIQTLEGVGFLMPVDTAGDKKGAADDQQDQQNGDGQRPSPSKNI